MIEINTEDATKDLALCDAIQLGVVGIAAMQKWFADLAQREGISFRDQEVFDNIQGKLAKMLVKLEDLVEDTIPPYYPTRAPDAIKDEGGVQPMPLSDDGRATPDDSPGDDGAIALTSVCPICGGPGRLSELHGLMICTRTGSHAWNPSPEPTPKEG